MKRKQNNYGLTLVEILVAVTIVALLAAGLYSVSNYLETQSKIKLAESTIDTIVAAIEQYHDFYGKFPFETDANFGRIQLQDVNCLNGIVAEKQCADLTAADYNNIYSSSEALYYFLNKVPASRKIVDSINRSFITNKDYKNIEYFIQISGQCYPLVHIIDPWQRPFRYTYASASGNNFPLIESAGPNRDFGDKDPNWAKDNISSR